MNSELLKVLACPICYQSLDFIKEESQLFCKFDCLFFRVYNGIPVFLQRKLLKISMEHM